MDYDEFVRSKALVVEPCGLEVVPELNPMLFDFQRDVTRWALRRGKAAVWLDCGLGKSFVAAEWSRCVHEHTGGRVLILTPLAVAPQFVAEGEKFGIPIAHCKTSSDLTEGINVTNYERLHHFNPDDFVGVVCDESSCLKDFTSATRNQLISSFVSTPFRLACTATPAPNDYMELGNHAEFLGVMSRTEMLSMFFCHDGGETQKWRLKGHARDEFWKWIAGWACNIRKPSDLGYSDEGFELPPLVIHEHVVSIGETFAREQGKLFADDARTLSDQRAARRASLEKRVELIANLVNADSQTGEPWIVWTELNDESSALAKAIPDAIEVRGSDPADKKEDGLSAFTTGKARVIISKASIAGWGLNWQHCANVAYVGVGNSFEGWYQSVRRAFRFGQKRQVNCHIARSDVDGAIANNLRRKQLEAEQMSDGMARYTAEFTKAELTRASRRETDEYNPTKPMIVPSWIEGDAA